ncbi:DUF2059 domain-containing protein [Sphingomonas sp. ST-64]|uniref:DUF2059 domain-containing protein n=1 Tax=Sphingomonas plantiphila TaxID=3163295 RepID=A0ABW8YKV1_9SPHN
MIRSMAIASALLATSPAFAQAAPAAPAPASEIDPARLAAAERVAAALVPPGTYVRMMRDQFPAMMDAMMSQMMGMTAADLGAPDAKSGGETLGKSIAEGDPHFRERMSIMTKVMGEEFGAVFDKVEPRLRVGLSRAFARKFTTAQLNELNAFFATPTGKAFSGDYLATFMDPEVMQEMMAATPELMKAMPAIVAKVEKATAHLPPPPKQDSKK